jgi:hypothetical protein
VAHVCPTPCFVLSCSWEKFGTVPPNSSQNWSKFGHNTSSVAAEPFHVLHVNLMSDDSMCNDHFLINFKREAWSLFVNF